MIFFSLRMTSGMNQCDEKKKMKNKISDDDDDDERNKINQPIGISMENGFNQKKSKQQQQPKSVK